MHYIMQFCMGSFEGNSSCCGRKDENTRNPFENKTSTQSSDDDFEIKTPSNTTAEIGSGHANIVVNEPTSNNIPIGTTRKRKSVISIDQSSPPPSPDTKYANEPKKDETKSTIDTFNACDESGASDGVENWIIL